MLLRYLIVFSILVFCDGYKVLVVFPIPGRSHSILGEGYVKHLLDAGHEVTYITPIPMKDTMRGLRQIDVSENFKFLQIDAFDIGRMMRKEINLEDYAMWTSVMVKIVEGTLKTKVIQDFLMDPNEKFDVVIHEWLFNEFGAAYATIFNCPLIWSSSMIPHTHVLHLIDEHLNPAYTFRLLGKKSSLTFLDRVQNLWHLLKITYFKWTFMSRETKIYEDAFGPAAAIRGRTLPPFDEVRYNASLMLGNSHICMGDAIALPQNYKDIGGYHIAPKPKPLPKNIQEIMDNSTNGVIYFSLGTMLEPSKLSNDLKRRFVNMFGELKQTLIWKIEQDLPDLPKNVHVFSWVPQQSILAHPNTVLFMTHGGLLSTTESVFFGVPIIGMPFFADQPLSIERAVFKGFGKSIELNDETPTGLKEIINEMISNTSYHQRAKELSATYHDKLVPPGKELVFWVEHVVKTRGAPHLRSIALQMEWYKKLYLDLALIILLIGAFTIFTAPLFLRPMTIARKKKIA